MDIAGIFDVPEEERKKMLRDKMSEIAQENKKKGLPVCYGDEKSVFLIEPNGEKKIIKEYTNEK
jgi:hypothetical protein